MRWVKRIVFGLVALAVVAAIAWAYRPRPVAIEIATVAHGPMHVTVDADAKTRVRDRYVVSAPVHGEMARIELEPGDEVREGAVLARIVPALSPLLDVVARQRAEANVRMTEDAERQARATVDRAVADAQRAQQDAARQRQLFATGSTPRVTLDQAEADERARAAELASARFALQVAGHTVETARATLRRFTRLRGADGAEPPVEVTAPANGRVLRVMQESAGVVNAGTPILEVADPSALEVVADVLTEDGVQIHPGAHVTIARWGGSNALDARVRFVEPAAFTKVSALGVEEQRVNVIIDLDPPAERWRALGDAFRVPVEIETWASDDVVRVPEGAVFRVGEQWAVFVVDGGRAMRRFIEVGARNGREAQIVRGLRVGERVIVHPGDTIADGTAVRAM